MAALIPPHTYNNTHTHMSFWWSSRAIHLAQRSCVRDAKLPPTCRARKVASEGALASKTVAAYRRLFLVNIN